MAQKRKGNLKQTRQNNIDSNKMYFIVAAIVIVLVAGALLVTSFSTSKLTANQKDGSRVFGTYCTNCHIANGQGNAQGIDLSNVGSRRNAYWLKIWINDPKSISKKATMPGFKLGDAETKNLIDYLSSLK